MCVPRVCDAQIRTRPRFLYNAPTPSFIILCLLIWKLSCWQTNKQTNKQTPLKTSNALRYATTLGKILLDRREVDRWVVGLGFDDGRLLTLSHSESWLNRRRRIRERERRRVHATNERCRAKCQTAAQCNHVPRNPTVPVVMPLASRQSLISTSFVAMQYAWLFSQTTAMCIQLYLSSYNDGNKLN